MEELNICPSTLAEGFNTYSPTALRLLFDGRVVSHVLTFDSPNNDESNDNDYSSHVGRISLSGVQPKASLTMNDAGELVKPAENQRGQYILKPAPQSYALLERRFCPANEHLSMQIASQVYHFDVSPTGEKYQQEDLASIAGLTKANGGSDYKYSRLSYEECAELIWKNTSAPSIEVLKFFRIVVFNYLILNDDAHLKNFSLINRGDGEYHLSPAYDLVNTSLHLHEPRIFALDKGLFREGMVFTDTHTVNRGDFEEFGRRIGLAPRLVKRELDYFASEQPLAKELINRSFLSDKLKRYYWQSYNYRRTTLTFTSE